MIVTKQIIGPVDEMDFQQYAPELVGEPEIDESCRLLPRRSFERDWQDRWPMAPLMHRNS
jgi:hypothetical protein